MKNFAPVLALVATTGLITGSALALTAGPALASTTASSHHVATGHPRVTGQRLSPSRLAEVRDRQRQLAARHRAAPTFARAGSTTFAVDTTEDSPLGTPGDTHCVDLSTGKCSLRAAVEAANNLDVPVKIVLRKRTYTLSTGSQLVVTSRKGISIVGKGAGPTIIEGAGSGLFYLDQDSDGNPSTLFLTSLRLRDGHEDYGGAVEMGDYTGTALVLDHVTLSHNTADNYGGAIIAYSNSSVFISDSKLTDNAAPQGGAIYQYWSDLTLHDTDLTDNSTDGPTPDGEGGAVYNYYGVFDMTGGSLSGNTAGNDTDRGTGGALYNAYSLSTLHGVHVDDNTATGGSASNGYGGAVFGYEDVFAMTGGSMSHNQVLGVDGASGGGIYGNYQNQIGLHGVSMVGNKAAGTEEGAGGGAVFAYAASYPTQLVIDGGRITRSNNSAVYLYGDYAGVDASISDVTFANNTDGADNGLTGFGCGGAICSYGYEYAGMNLELSGSTLVGNSSAGNVGSGAVGAYTSNSSTSSVSLNGNTFSKNVTGDGGYGGAVGLYADSQSPISARMAHNTFSHNRAGTQSAYGVGGALSLTYYAALKDTGSTFSHNSARGGGAYGGAVSDNALNSSLWNRTRFVDNSAGTNNGANDGYGGAFYSSNYSGDLFTQVTMSGNKAAYQGGGYYGDGNAYQTVFKSSTVSGNTAGSDAYAGQGGGVYGSDTVLTTENSTFTGNKATSTSTDPGQGGAVFMYSSGSTADLRYSTVSGNYAKEGAGVYLDTYGSVLGTILSGNKTSKHGSEKDCTVTGSAYKLKSLGGNVLGQKGCVQSLRSSDKVSRKLHLGKLEDNGGPTRTMAISQKSPAVGRASYLIPGKDQRGHARPGKHADAGAFEVK